MAPLLDEFEIHPLSGSLFSAGGHPVVFTNSALLMLLAVMCASLLMMVGMRRRALVPGRFQMAAESIYNMIVDMVEGAAGKHAEPFVPFVFSIFVFILFCNVLGLIPYSFTVTSQIIVNFSLAIFLFIVIIITGFVRHGVRFFALFAPPAPKVMLPFMIVVEFLSFVVRPFSLSIRLFANMMAGHILLQVFAGMVASLLAAGWLSGFSVLPLLADVGITGFELFVALLQAYIYAILSAVYLRDAIEMH
ncbi:MAG TPA: F0F1 ATP synthase subunit A [Alphaproteobacteria bacterium]|nr:F0F1 ATP synthase subunit A [Alphaproteobacteria bacterium]